MPKAIRVYETGGPEKLKWEDVAITKPGPNEVLVRNTAVGLNYIDTYHRRGLYPLALPTGLGLEGAGVVEAVGPRVKDFKAGDRVCYVNPVGAYAQMLLRPADRLVKIPREIDDKVAAAVLLKGMTAEFLLRRTIKVMPKDVILVHAAAGGVGQIICPWAKHIGATVIGTVGSEEKVGLAKKAGCKHVIVNGKEDLAARVREITKGKGVRVVYDGIGKDTFIGSLDSLAPRGLMVLYGAASGPVPPFDLSGLAQRSSLFVTRPVLFHYVEKRDELLSSARELFSVIKKGIVKVKINQTYPLAEAATAHQDLEARRTTGSTVLLP